VVTFKKTTLLPYTPAKLYNLVNDVESYSHFVPYCTQGQVLEKKDTHVIASLTLGSMGIHTTLVTRNTLQENHTIHMQLLSGPLKDLDGLWEFKDTPNGTEITLCITYTLGTSWVDGIAGPLIEKVIHHMADVFTQEAHRRYA